MSNRFAFVMGSNGSPELGRLKYAESDADRISSTLSDLRCRFRVFRPKPTADTYDLRRDLDLVVASCAPADTFICYFAGHGLIHDGELFLVWNNTTSDLLTTGLPADTLLTSLRRCRARNKMLILDCCHAGAAAGNRGLGFPFDELPIASANHLVLMASGRLEPAREFERLGGGFLSQAICAALGQEFHEADRNRDLRLTIDELMDWIELNAFTQNQSSDERVPIPRLFGERQGEFFFTPDETPWDTFEILWPDQSTLVVVPIHPITLINRGSSVEYAMALGKTPVTNAQFAAFLKHKPGSVKIDEPCGQTRDQREGRWVGPFYPWKTEGFNGPNLPVVCVSYDDSIKYCRWANELTPKKYKTSVIDLPAFKIWDYVALDTEYPSRDPKNWRGALPKVHHRSDRPAEVDLAGERYSKWGITDLLGNVWEWCTSLKSVMARNNLLPEFQRHRRAFEEDRARARGGGFLDDLSIVPPFLNEFELDDGKFTCHTDLGFRVGALIPTKCLPSEIAERLYLFEPLELLQFSDDIAFGLGERSDFDF